jgi:hypothetical protein
MHRNGLVVTKSYNSFLNQWLICNALIINNKSDALFCGKVRKILAGWVVGPFRVD